MANTKFFFGLIFCIAIAIIIIFYKFNQIPSRTFFDEVESARLALELAKRPLSIYVDYSTGHTTPYYYILLGSLKFLGISTFALRIPSAFFGIFSVGFFYLLSYLIFSSFLTKKQTDNIVLLSFTSAFILSTSRWFFNFARYSFQVTFLLFLELVSVYFFIKFIKEKKTIQLVLCSLFAGLSFSSYASGRFFFIVIILSLILAKKSLSLDITKKQFVLAFSVFIITVTPLIYHLKTHSDIRFQQQVYFQNNELTITDKIGFFSQNVKKNILMFVGPGDINGRHNYPAKAAISPFLMTLLFLGIVRIIMFRIKFYDAFFIIWTVISVFPTLLTYPWENPHMLRTFTILAPIAYFSASSFFVIEKIAKRFVKVKANAVATAVLILFIMLSAVYDARTYFKYQPAVFEMQFDTVEDLSEADLNLLPKSIGR